MGAVEGKDSLQIIQPNDLLAFFLIGIMVTFLLQYALVNPVTGQVCTQVKSEP